MSDSLQIISEKLGSVQLLMREGKFDEAQQIMGTLTAEADAHWAEVDETECSYFTFFEPFEDMMYRCIYQPEKDVTQASYPFAYIYLQQGSLFIDLKRYDDAIEALTKACRWNPCHVSLAAELAEAYKLTGNLEKFYEITKDTFKFVFRTTDFARLLRNVAFYQVEKGNYRDAAIFTSMSLNYEKSNNALEELKYILAKSNEQLDPPSFDDMKACAEEHGIPIVPDEKAYKLAMDAGRYYSDTDKHLAKYCLQIAYDLTEIDEIKKMIDSL